jgi:hypothetical protein
MVAGGATVGGATTETLALQAPEASAAAKTKETTGIARREV